MKIVRQKQQAAASESPRAHHSELIGARIGRDTALDRAEVADQIIRKMSYGTYRVRANLLKWLKSEQKVTKFDLATLKKFGLLSEKQINGKLGAEMKALRKANQEIFLGLVQFPVSELWSYYKMMSLASIQRRYGRRIDDRDIPVEVTLDIERKVESAPKPELRKWMKSKANQKAIEQRQTVVDRLKQKAKRKVKRVVQSISDYVADMNKFSRYVEDGLKQRRKWMNAIEKRTGLKQKMHNSD